MQERANKFKQVSKKEVPPLTIMNQENSLTQESKLSSNSQNKLFIRKPVLKRNGFISPSFTKNRVLQNEEVKSPTDLYKSKMCIQSDSRSDQDYWQGKDTTGFGTIVALKKYIMTQQTVKNQLLNNTKTPRMALEAYYGNQSHALTQIGEHYKLQAIQIDDCQKDSYLKQKMWKNSKQNIVANGLSTKKVTRTEYFANPNTEEARPTSCSLREKQLNFNLLRHSVNNNIEAYVMSLENNVRKLQKNNYAINNKCKWMHEEIEMHLEKEHLMASEKKGLELQLQTKYKEVETLRQEKSNLQKQLAQLKIQFQKKESSKSDKSFKDLQTISSLKQLCSKAEQTNFRKTSKVQQKLQAYFGIIPSSIDKSKKKSFRTYPGVCSPRKSKDEGSKCSSITGNNESFQDFTQSSILCQKSNNKSQMTDRKCLITTQELRKQRDELRATVESINLQIKILKEKDMEKVNQKNQQLQKKLYQLQQKYENLQFHSDEIQNQKSMLLMEIDQIKQKNLTEIQSLTTKIKELEDQISLHSRTSIHSVDQKLQEENPLRYFLQNTDKNYGQASQTQSFQQENKSLRLYIQKIIEQYKYVKIENRMLLKVKQEKEILEKEKKKIKEERDSFKKKLLDLVKNSKNIGKQPTKSCRRIMDFESDSSEEEDSAVFQLSKSEIKLHQQSEFEKV